MNNNNEISCVFSPCRKYRYVWRIKTNCVSKIPGSTVSFIGLNPSTADEVGPDNTVRRCIDYATRWGFDYYVMLNLFGYRATDPKDMKAVNEPTGDDNDFWIKSYAKTSDLIVAAWGVHGEYRNRGNDVIDLVHGTDGILMCLGKTKHGYPRHPLYLKKDAELIPITSHGV